MNRAELFWELSECGLTMLELLCVREMLRVYPFARNDYELSDKLGVKPESLRVHTSRVRSKIKPMGYTVVRKRHFGYSIEPVAA